MTDRIVVVEGTRTPFVRARSVFAKMPPSALGGVTLKETVARSGIDPKLIDEIYFGIVSPPAEGSNIAREALFDSGLPQEIPCTTINRYCASGLEATAGASAKILAGQIDIALAGGVEGISAIRALFSLEATNFFQDFAKAKNFGQMMGHMTKFKTKFLTPMAPGIKEPTTGLTMGQSADLMCRLFQVGREEQDRYALESHQKAHQAWERGFYQSHVIPVATPDSKVVDRDTDIRADSSMEKLGKLKPVFYKDGTITAGNASPLTDGAASVLIMKESRARELGLKPLLAIRSYATRAVNIQKEPLLIGPAYAIPAALKMAGLTWDQIDLLEVHEAFAGQVLSTIRAIESDSFAKEKLGMDKAIGRVDWGKFNLNGGSIPLGHPFGATGARLIIQLGHALREKKKNLGLISVCAAGGLGSVMVVEAI